MKENKNILEELSDEFKKKLRKYFGFRYPKLAILIIAVALAYYIFKQPGVSAWVSGINDYSYLGIFVAGLFFSFGFSTPFAIGFFLVSRPENIFLAAIIGGFGALLSDLLIFRLIRFSFSDEINLLRKTEVFREIDELIKLSFRAKIRRYLLYAFAGLIIASPLPDEVGVGILAGLTHIKQKNLAMISFVMNAIGILAMLYLGAVL